MGTRHSAQQVEDGQPDGDEDAVQDVEGQHRDRRRQREEQLTAAEPGDPPELWDIDQAGRRVDHDRAEGSSREGSEDRSQEHHGQQDGCQRDERVQLAPAAEGVSDHRAAAAAAHREPLHHAGRHVRGTEGEQLLVGVDGVAVAGCEGAPGQHVVGVRHDRHPDSRQQQRPHVAGGDRRQGGSRQSRGDLPHDGDATSLEVEDRDRGGGQEHPHQGHRRTWPQVAPDEEQGQHRGGKDEGRSVDLVQVAGDVRDLGGERVRIDVDAGDLAELAGDHDRGDPRHVADEHGLGEQVREEPQSAGQPSTHHAPTTSASAAASAAYRSGSPTVIEPTAAAVMSAVVDSGPTDSWREEPSTA